MAFTVTARDQSNNGTTSAGTQTSASFTPTASSFLIAAGHGCLDLSSGNKALPASPVTGTGGLTWTARQTYETTAAPRYNNTGAVDFRVNSGIWTADVGGSPASQTVTFDAATDATFAFYALALVDVTGHDTGTPHVQSAKNSSTENNGSNSVSLAVTLGVTPTTGNLVVAVFGANADGGGGFTAPTIGGQSMTQVYNLANASTQNGVWYREITGAESTAVTTCTDVGQTVGGATGFVIEIAAAAPATPSTIPGLWPSRRRRI
jgi:hypothetical protein